MKGTVLVVGDYQQSITVVRSLARAGHGVVVGRQQRRAFSSWSRFADGTWIHPDPGDAAFLPALHALLDRRPDIQALYPVGEADMAGVMGDFDALASRCAVVMPNPPVARACFDKMRMYGIAREQGVPVPPTTLVANLDELLAHARAIGPPLVLKCPDSFRLIGGEKAAIASGRQDVEAWRWSMRDAAFPLILQQRVPGDRHNCQFAAIDGEIVAFFQQRVLRTDRLDGTGFGVDGISVAPSRALRQHCAALVERVRYTGAGCAQFLVDDRRNAAAFLELNPRLDATCELPYRLGFDFPALALHCASRGAARIDVPADYPAGRRFHWLLGDLRAVAGRARRRDVRPRETLAARRRLAGSHWSAQCHLTWIWSDPLPTLFLYARALAAFGALTRGRRAKG